MSKGKLIVLEGLDGSGKATQAKLLTAHLKEQGFSVREITFPNYESDSSALVKMYLAGQFGQHPDDVNAYAASSFYAVDRYASWKKVWGEYYTGGGLVLSDRYTTSNAVHQACKLPEPEWEGFFQWLYDFEHAKLGLPRPDLVVYLDMPTERSIALLRAREQATHTQGDIHEVDAGYLALCRKTALRAAECLGWRTVACVDAAGALRPAEEIHRDILALIQPILP